MVNTNDKIDRLIEDVAIVRTKVEYLVDVQKVHRSTHERLDTDIVGLRITQAHHTSSLKKIWILVPLLLGLLGGGKVAIDALSDTAQAAPTPITQPAALP